MVLGHPSKKSQNLRKIFTTIFVFVGHFFFHIDVFKLQEAFSRHGIRVFLRMDLEVCLDISYFTDFRQTRAAKKIPKTSFVN
jgi:hypothetical protein